MFDVEKYVDLLISFFKTNDSSKLEIAESYRIQEIPNKLMKFFSLSEDSELNEKKLDCLSKQCVYCSPLDKLNDPFEINHTAYTEKNREKYGIDDKNFNSYLIAMNEVVKIISFTMNDEQCMPMWAHYANNHQGYCVEFEVSEHDLKSLFKVNYMLERNVHDEVFYAHMNSAFLNNKNLKKYTEAIMKYFVLSRKHLSWQYENEVRYIAFTDSDYCEMKVKKIYIGYNCSKDNIEKLIQIARTIGCEVFLMKNVCKESSYNLECERVE